jgi:hypothetical protein
LDSFELYLNAYPCLYPQTSEQRQIAKETVEGIARILCTSDGQEELITVTIVQADTRPTEKGKQLQIRVLEGRRSDEYRLESQAVCAIYV